MKKIDRNKAYTLFVELIIVFVGVYAAFLLDDVRTQKRNQRKSVQIYKSLLEQVTRDSIDMHKTFTMLDTLVILPYLTAHEKGLMPELKPLFIGSAGYSTRTWEAILATGGLDILDIELIENMESYYFHIHILVDHMKKLESLSVQQVLPNLDKPRTEFYDPETRTIREEYRWYMQTLASMQKLNKDILQENSRLLETLRAKR
jgi:hypothetical protein